jgi:ABC-2 type transport system ATP-binding protein
MYAVETQNLVKKYGKTYALKGLDFKVNLGEIMVLLGPNGSGKTTLLLTLATVLKPTSGIAKVMDLEVTKHPTQVRKVLGISFQEARGFWRHKPAEILRFHAAMCGTKKTERETKIEEVLKTLELWEARNKLFMHLSGGQTKRLGGKTTDTTSQIRNIRRTKQPSRSPRQTHDLGANTAIKRRRNHTIGRHKRST